MARIVGYKKPYDHKNRFGSVKTSVEVYPGPSRISGDVSYPTKSSFFAAFDIYCMGKDHKIHKARLRVKERRKYRYLYIAYRDGDKITDRYIAKLEGAKSC